MAYWGGVLDNAQRIAKTGNTQDRKVALMMLRMATDAITGSEGKPIAEKRGANIHADIIDNSGNIKKSLALLISEC